MNQLLLMGIPKDAAQAEAMRRIFNEVGNERSYILPPDADVAQTLRERVARGHRRPHLIFASYARFPQAFDAALLENPHLAGTPMIVSHIRQKGIATNLQAQGFNVVLAKRPEELFAPRAAILDSASTVVGEVIRRLGADLLLDKTVNLRTAQTYFKQASSPNAGHVIELRDGIPVRRAVVMQAVDLSADPLADIRKQAGLAPIGRNRKR